MKLTRGKLLSQNDWTDWQDSEYLQLDQYDAQGMFGNPVRSQDGDAIFHLVWTYAIKAVDGRKKARCVCDGSTRSGSVQILDETYANCVDQTSSRLFYAIAAAENLLIFVQMYRMPLQRHLLRNKDSISVPTRLFTNGGLNTNTAHLFHQATSFQSSQLCKVTQSPHVFGKSTQMQSSAN